VQAMITFRERLPCLVSPDQRNFVLSMLMPHQRLRFESDVLAKKPVVSHHANLNVRKSARHLSAYSPWEISHLASSRSSASTVSQVNLPR
jgi:hypothetical protein